MVKGAHFRPMTSMVGVIAVVMCATISMKNRMPSKFIKRSKRRKCRLLEPKGMSVKEL